MLEYLTLISDMIKTVNISGVIPYMIVFVFELVLCKLVFFACVVLQAFFQRWWREQSDDIQNIVKGLVKSGQLEFMYSPILSSIQIRV